jgi:RluA family pseudouridine synthase
MPDPGFAILLEDDACLGVIKPSGIATQAPVEYDSLEARIKRYLAPAGSDPAEVYLGIPHRLDRPVTGVMIFAKTRRAARNLAKQFERRRVQKRYWACVERVVEPNAGTWTDYLWKVYGEPRAQVVDAAHPGAQEAVLRYRTVGRHRAGSVLEIELETGRTHQIRVQASSRGHAVLGDTMYGARSPFGPTVDEERQQRIGLLARELVFFHPSTREETRLIAPLDEAWDALELDLAAS